MCWLPAVAKVPAGVHASPCTLQHPALSLHPATAPPLAGKPPPSLAPPPCRGGGLGLRPLPASSTNAHWVPTWHRSGLSTIRSFPSALAYVRHHLHPSPDTSLQTAGVGCAARYLRLAILTPSLACVLYFLFACLPLFLSESPLPAHLFSRTPCLQTCLFHPLPPLLLICTPCLHTCLFHPCLHTC